MDTRRRSSSPSRNAEGTAALSPVVPTLSIALTIPLPMAWSRRMHGRDAVLPGDMTLTLVEFALGEGRGRSLLRRPARRLVRRRATEAVPSVDQQALPVPAPSFATAMREGAWWLPALARLRRRTREWQVLRLLPL